MLRLRKILCPVDFDANSIRMLGQAAELARERHAKLYLLHVVPTPPGPEVAVDFIGLEDRAKKRLDRLVRKKLGRRTGWEVHVRSGPPALEVMRAAERFGVDLIVMATHGRKGLKHLVLGSVAESVVREAPCPVLTMSPKVAARVARAASVKTTRRVRGRTGGNEVE
jgi:nucleotide-binding universal stress UspA family protein